MKRKVIQLILIIIILLVEQKVFAVDSNIQINVDKSELVIGEEGKVSITLPNINIASFTLEIYYNHDNLDYISGPETSNETQNRIIYTWTDSTAKGKTNIKIEPFVFKAVAGKLAQINVTGEFYDKDGNKLNIEPQIFNWNISDEIQTQNVEGNFDKTNADLDILRLSHEGIIPQFDKDITEYYITVDTSVEDIDVEAVAVNPNAKINITGSGKISLGKNTITINVISEDGTKSKSYKIYVTKTDNLEKANANLETLAIRQGTLTPEFSELQSTEYRTEIDSNVETIDILAIPQNQNAKVTIQKDEIMNVGDNKVYVNVLAEDGITNRKYTVTVHRRSEEEQKAYTQEQEEQIEKAEQLIDTISNEINENIVTDEVKEEQQNEERNNIIIIIIACIILAIVIFIIVKNKMYKKL